jgi:hypothetical protein
MKVLVLVCGVKAQNLMVLDTIYSRQSRLKYLMLGVTKVNFYSFYTICLS